MKHYGTAGGRVSVPVISVVYCDINLKDLVFFFFVLHIVGAHGREGGREGDRQVGR